MLNGGEKKHVKMYTSYVTIYINSKTDKIRLRSRSCGGVGEWEEAAELGAGCAIYLTGAFAM